MALIRGALESLEEDDITVSFLRHALIAMRGARQDHEVYEYVQLQEGAQMSIAFLEHAEGWQIICRYLQSEAEKWNAYPDAMRRAIQTLNYLPTYGRCAP